MSRIRKRFSFIVISLGLLASLGFAASASADLLAYSCVTPVSYDVCTVDPDNTADHKDLTETDYNELQPTWSPDGKLISFIGDYPGKNGLYVTDPAAPGEGTEVLEGGGGYAAWSPDGAWIAAEEYESKTNMQYGVVFPSNGTGTPHRVGLENVSEVHPAWSADSKTIAFTHANTVYTAPADGSGEAKVLKGGIGNQLAWSPDGAWIAAISATDDVVRAIAADGSGAVFELSDHAELGSTIAWSPDSKHVAYVNDSDKVWVAPINSAEGPGFEIPMPAGTIVPHEPVFSPDGTRIAFSAGTNKPGEESDQIYVGASNGTQEARQITQTTTGNFEPDWRPEPGAFKPPPPPTETGGEQHKSGGERRQPPTIKFASYHHPLVIGEGLTGVYVDCSLGSTNAACQFHGEGSTGASPIGVKPRLYVRSKPKRMVVLKGSVKVPNGKKKELPLKLTPAGRTLLKRDKTLKVDLTITQSAAGFETVKTSKTIKIKAPHKH